MKEKLFRCFKWWGGVILAHAVAFLLFSILFSNMVVEMQIDGAIDRAFALTLIFGLIFWLAFVAFYQCLSLGSMEATRRMKNQLKECNGSVFACIKKHYAAELLCMLGVVILNQLPLTVFFATWGLSFEQSSIIERLWIANLGFYGVTGSAFWGLLLLVLWFSLLLIGSFYLTLRGVAKD